MIRFIFILLISACVSEAPQYDLNTNPFHNVRDTIDIPKKTIEWQEYAIEHLSVLDTWLSEIDTCAPNTSYICTQAAKELQSFNRAKGYISFYADVENVTDVVSYKDIQEQDYILSIWSYLGQLSGDCSNNIGNIQIVESEIDSLILWNQIQLDSLQ